MAVPKKRVSLTRRRNRRTHYKAQVRAMGKCSNCGSVTSNFHVCVACGYYKGKQYFDPDAKKNKAAEA